MLVFLLLMLLAQLYGQKSFSWNLRTFNLCASKDLFQLQFDGEVSQEKTCQMAHHKCTAAKEDSFLLRWGRVYVSAGICRKRGGIWVFGSWCVAWQMYMCACLCCGACSFARCLVRKFPQGVSSQPYSPCHGYATPVTPLDTCDTRLEVLHKPNAMGALEWKNLRKWYLRFHPYYIENRRNSKLCNMHYALLIPIWKRMCVLSIFSLLDYVTYQGGWGERQEQLWCSSVTPPLGGTPLTCDTKLLLDTTQNYAGYIPYISGTPLTWGTKLLLDKTEPF